VLESLPVPEPQAQEPIIQTEGGASDAPAVETASGAAPEAGAPVETPTEAPPAPEASAAPEVPAAPATESAAPQSVDAPELEQASGFPGSAPPESESMAAPESPAPAEADAPAATETAMEPDAAPSETPVSPQSEAAVVPGPPAARESAPEAPRTPAPSDTRPHWMLSLFSPAPSDVVDWGRGNYTILSRGGRIESPAKSGDLKRQVHMVAEGSVVYAASVPRGGAPDVAPDGFAHPVYRAGFAVAIPLPEVG
jgi:hypothetical protein